MPSVNGVLIGLNALKCSKYSPVHLAHPMILASTSSASYYPISLHCNYFVCPPLDSIAIFLPFAPQLLSQHHQKLRLHSHPPPHHSWLPGFHTHAWLTGFHTHPGPELTMDMAGFHLSPPSHLQETIHAVHVQQHRLCTSGSRYNDYLLTWACTPNYSIHA